MGRKPWLKMFSCDGDALKFVAMDICTFAWMYNKTAKPSVEAGHLSNEIGENSHVFRGMPKSFTKAITMNNSSSLARRKFSEICQELLDAPSSKAERNPASSIDESDGGDSAEPPVVVAGRVIPDPFAAYLRS